MTVEKACGSPRTFGRNSLRSRWTVLAGTLKLPDIVRCCAEAASLWETLMTPSQVEAIAAADNATVAIINALLTFLEKQGVLKREDFATFLSATIEGWRAEGADEKLMRLIEIKAKGMALDPPPSVHN